MRGMGFSLLLSYYENDPGESWNTSTKLHTVHFLKADYVFSFCCYEKRASAGSQMLH